MREDFHFELPEHLIAQYPMSNRSASRLLYLSRQSGDCAHRQFKALPDFLNQGDLLVFNDTRVIPARLYGEKETGGRVELLIERVIDNKNVKAYIRSSNPPQAGATIWIDKQYPVRIIKKQDALFVCEFLSAKTVWDIIEQIGSIPLPPYINREPDETDVERYQTIFARKKGAIAAPTAGLHFDTGLLDKIAQKGINVEYVTLHVGAGTFNPVRVSDLNLHKMHPERFEITQAVCDKIVATKRAGKRVFAVGTTVVRVLESAVKRGALKAESGETDIFIKGGYHFQVIDGLITNFHLPESTLLMLVSAFAGRQSVLNAYQTAVEQEYRFFSYGDAMIIC